MDHVLQDVETKITSKKTPKRKHEQSSTCFHYRNFLKSAQSVRYLFSIKVLNKALFFNPLF